MEVLVNIDVPDLERAIVFYRDALGLQPGRLLFDGAVVEMTGAPVPLYLLAKPEGSRPATPTPDLRRYSRHWTPVHLDFAVEDLEAALERALRAGAKLENGPHSYLWGRLATLADPFGHGFCLLQWSEEGYEALKVR